PSGGGTGSIAVTAAAGCSWTAASNASWITITSGSSGSGNGTVGYSVATNASSSSRTGTMTVTGQAFTVMQAGASSYTLPAGPSTVVVGDSLPISWTAPSGRPPNDWIGLYRVGDPNTAYLWWVYTNGAASGNSTLAAPYQAGQYEFRYLPDDGLADVARSNPVTVGQSSGYALTASPSTVTAGGALTVSWTAPGGRPSLDWIELSRVGN